MAESLFTTQTPATQADAGHDLTVGTVIVPAVAGQVTHGRWLFPTQVPSTSPAFVLYDASTQAQLARATFSGGTANTWVTVTLSSPVSVTAGQRLVAAVYTPGPYVATSGFFASAGLTNGNLSAPATGSDPIGNGRFNDPGDAYPASTFNGNCYFVDVVFTASAGGQSVAPAGVSVPVAVGSPAAGWSVSAAPDGLALSVALGSPAVAAAGVAPDGVSVPVAVGDPLVGWSAVVAPGGLLVPVAVGAAGVSVPGQRVPRPSTGVVSRPAAGVVARPDLGVVVRP